VTLAGCSIPGGTIGEFWQWGASDLRGNTLRGRFAEWLVGLLLGIDMDVRVEWDDVDHRRNDIKIEVKSCSYIQGWEQHKLSTIVFGALVKQAWDEASEKWVGEGRLNADWYVFALENCQDGPSFNPLDLSQWEFYVVPRAKLEGLHRGQRLSLKRVAELGTRMKAEQLQTCGPRMMGLVPGT
jgi:hypothetical protein